MDFKNTDLLQLIDMNNLSYSSFPNTKASIISKKLANYCFINNARFYCVEDNLTYKYYPLTTCKTKLMTLITLYLQKSFEHLSAEDQESFKRSNQGKQFANLFQNREVESYYSQLITQLEKNVTFDSNLNEIHFENGYYDIKNETFKVRELHTHYVTHYVHRDYVQSTQAEQNEIMHHIRKIYPSKEDLEIILLILGSALSGKSNIDQETLFLLGPGSAGKSLILENTLNSLGCYAKELNNEVFCSKNGKVDKILNTFANSPYIRITWVNEIKDTKLDAALFKKFCEGRLQTTKLYEEESHDIVHNSKCIVTSNTMIAIKVDTGVERRWRGYTHSSEFTDDRNKVDESKHIYLKDKDLLSKLSKGNLPNAWFDILIGYCCKWLKGIKPKFNKNFIETKSAVMGSNDTIQDFIDGHFILTETSTDRISKAEMESLFKKQNPDKHLSIVQLITSLRDKGLNYNASMRVDGVRGCFTHLKQTMKRILSSGSVKKSDLTSYTMQLENQLQAQKDEIELLKTQLNSMTEHSRNLTRVTYEYDVDDTDESGDIPSLFKCNIFNNNIEKVTVDCKKKSKKVKAVKVRPDFPRKINKKKRESKALLYKTKPCNDDIIENDVDDMIFFN